MNSTGGTVLFGGGNGGAGGSSNAGGGGGGGAALGGAIFSEGATLEIKNSTISGNTVNWWRRRHRREQWRGWKRFWRRRVVRNDSVATVNVTINNVTLNSNTVTNGDATVGSGGSLYILRDNSGGTYNVKLSNTILANTLPVSGTDCFLNNLSGSTTTTWQHQQPD